MRHRMLPLRVVPLAAVLLVLASHTTPATHASAPAAPAAQIAVAPGWSPDDWWPYPFYAYGHWPWWRPSLTITSPYSGSPGYPYYRYDGHYGYGYNPNYVPGSYYMYGPNYGYGPTTGTAGGQQYFQPPGGICYWSLGGYAC